MRIPFGLSVARSVDADSAIAAEPTGSYDADQQVWIGGDTATAAFCSGAKVCIGPVCYSYKRNFWDTGSVVC